MKNSSDKKSPVLFGDDSTYSVDSTEVGFVLNARKLLDFSFGKRFSETFVRQSGLSVGLLVVTPSSAYEDEVALESFFRLLRGQGIEKLYAIPTGYPHVESNSLAMEVVAFDPPLIGTISTVYSQLPRIRGGQVGIYSNIYYLFSPCLKFALLDDSLRYSLILGPERFVEEVFQMPARNTWDIVNPETMDADLYQTLSEAKMAYGYSHNAS